jgi:Methyltransferase FkbM domain
VPSLGTGAADRSSLELGLREQQFVSRPVDTTGMDDLDLGDIGFVGIDVEGHELAVLEGASHGYVRNMVLDARRYVHNFVFKPR